MNDGQQKKDLIQQTVEEGYVPEVPRVRKVWVRFDDDTETKALRGHISTALDLGDVLLFEEGDFPIEPAVSDTYKVAVTPTGPFLDWTHDEVD